MPEDELPPGTDFAYNLGEGILAWQSDRVDSLDTKAAVVMGVDGVLAGFLFRGSFEAGPNLMSFLASASLLLSLVAALLSFWTGKYAAAPDFDAVLKRIEASEAWLKWRFLLNLENAISANHIKLERKAQLLSLALTGLLVLVSVVGGYLFYDNQLARPN
jgi:hypothetical protein